MLNLRGAPQDAAALALAWPETASERGAGDVAQLVDRLLESLELILLTHASPGERLPVLAGHASPTDRLAQVAQKIETLPAPARAVMQKVLAEISGQLSQIKLLARQLQRREQQDQAARQQAQQDSMTDALTGLLNRRGFEELAPKAFDYARARRGDVILAFIDLDGMKQINDGEGHERGDLALQAAAQTLKASFRTQDLIARWGGDEFVVLSILNPMTPPQIEERLAEQARRYQLHNPGHPPVRFSVGMIHQHLGADSQLSALLAAADARMYRVKKGRRAAHPG